MILSELSPEDTVKFHHYLFEQHPGLGDITRLSDERVRVALPESAFAASSYEFPLDHRDQRALVVLDGELLWNSIPKAGDEIYSVAVGSIVTNAEHLRTARFGAPSYRVSQLRGKDVAILELVRHFLLLPAGTAVFRRFRDRRSLGPMYVSLEVKKGPKGHTVRWLNSSY